MTSSSSAARPPATPSGHGSVLGPGALTTADSLPLHPRLESLLRTVQAAERTAVGEHRRPTFRLMREVLGAAVRLGVPGHLLADCLGTSTGAIRNRANSADGMMTAELLQRLTGLTPRQLDQLSNGALTGTAGGPDRETYLMVDVIRAVLGTPRPPTD